MRTNTLVLIILQACLIAGCESEPGPAGESVGQGGSMTRFAINGSFMYVAGNSTIRVFNIEANNFEQVNEVTVGFGLETIFARGEYLYLGSNDAMYIYSISTPASPSFIFRYAHIVSCDPVVVQGNRAYVTLRSTETTCNRGENALEIIDITDPYHPSLVKNYPMESPHGLGVYENYLFLCEGGSGLKVFDISDEENIQLIKQITDIHAFDVIARANLITVTGEDGIFQYQFPEPSEVLKLLSKIDVQRQQL
jgi:hypothetical protein